MKSTMMKRTMPALLALVLLGMILPVHAEEAKKDAAAGDQAVLEIKLPKPMFVGTPKDVSSPNLDKSTLGKKRDPFMAPKDVKLLSLKKEVKASDKEPIIGEVAMVTDGDKEGSDGSFVELAPGLQYVTIDMGAPVEVFAIVAWHYHAQARVYHDVVVKCADDADFVTGVKTLFNNDHDNSSGLGVGKDKEYIESNEGKLFDTSKADNGKAVKTRYIRLYSNGNTANEMNHYIEVEVYGRQGAK